MTKVLIIDDEPLACTLVEEFLSKHKNMHIVSRCFDGLEGFKQINAHQPDLIFLDIQMPKINGFEMLELLDAPPYIIFTTAFDEYAIRAFEAGAIDYLLKPFSQERFDKAIAKFKYSSPDKKQDFDNMIKTHHLQGEENRIVIKDGSKIRILYYEDIIRLEADGDYVKIITNNGNFIKKQPLKQYQNRLNSKVFVLVHRSHIINTTLLQRIEPYTKNSFLAILKDKSQVPVSKSGHKNLMQVLNL